MEKAGDHVGRGWCRGRIVDVGADDNGHGDVVPMLYDGSMVAKAGRKSRLVITGRFEEMQLAG
jgi:hypothetical protein